MPRLSVSAVLTIAWCLSLPTAPGQDREWNRFRGPNGNGIATGSIPTRFGADTNVVWKVTIPEGSSSPILSARRVFLTAFQKDDLYTYAIERDTGKIAWRKKAPRARKTKVDRRNDPASPSPAVDADTVVVFFPDFGLLAYDHDGRKRWQHPLGPFHNAYGMGASPVIVGDLVYLACDHSRGSFLIALSKRDGKVAWKVDRPHARSGHCTPIVYRPEQGGPQLILPGSFYLDAYDAASGERLWWVSGLSFEMKSTPVLHDRTIYINGYGSPLNQPGNQVAMPPFADVVAKHDKNADGFIQKDEMPPSRAHDWFSFVDLDGDKKLGAADWSFLRDALQSQNAMLAIKAGGRGDMTKKSVRWSYQRWVPQLPSPLIVADTLYMLHDQGGRMTLLRPKTGEVIARGRVKGASDNYYASPVAAGRQILLVGTSGLVSVLEANGGLEPVAVSDLDEKCHATPAIAGGRVYLRTESTLYCFGRTESGGR